MQVTANEAEDTAVLIRLLKQEVADLQEELRYTPLPNRPYCAAL